jgi:hypothetical protein
MCEPSGSHKPLVQRQPRLISVSAIIVTLCLGFLSKFYTGPAHEWVNNSLGGVFYVIFWCQVIHYIKPGSSPFWVSICVLLATCAIEFSQLSHLRMLEVIRKTFLGRALIGNSFNVSDFGYYFAGAAVSWILQSCTLHANNSDK